MKEKDIQHAIIQYLQYRKDIYFIRNNSFSGSFTRANGSKGWLRNNKAGSPDIIVCHKGRYMGIEVKAEKGRQSELQQQAQKDIEKCGGVYIIARNIEDVERGLDKTL